jgi:hypothetical protein
MAFSAYACNLIEDWAAGRASMPAHGDRWIALFVGDPEDGGVEVTDLTTPRVNITAKWAESAPGTTTSNDTVSFGTATDDLVDVSHFATFDAASGGNKIKVAELTNGQVSIASGLPVQFSSGALVSQTA